MIHGMWSRPSTFSVLRAELEAAGIRSFAPTLLHHGVPPGSPAPTALASLQLADYVDALEREVAELGEPPVILGHSMGGLLAQLLAMRVRHRGLILLSTAPSSAAQKVSLAQLRTLKGVTTTWGWWREATLLGEEGARWGVFNGVPEAEMRAGLAELTWDSGPVMAQIAAPWLDSRKGSQVDYGRLTMPALVIAGREDRTISPATSRKTARLLAASGARVDYEEWPEVGHWLFHDAVRPRLAQAVARFLGSLGSFGSPGSPGRIG